MAAGLLLTVLALAPAVPEAEVLESGSLRLEVEPLDDTRFVTNIDFPFQRVRVTNLTSRSLSLWFQAQVEGYETNPPFPQPNALYLGPGESNQLYTFLDVLYGGLDLDHANQVTRRWTYTFQDQDSGREVSWSSTWELATWDWDALPQAGGVQGRVVDQDGQPVSGARVALYSAASTGYRDLEVSTTSDAQGYFSLPLPAVRDHFFLLASAQGYLYGFATLDEGTQVSAEITLSRGEPGQVRLRPLVARQEDIGFWRGVMAADGSKFLVVQGMENWGDPGRRSRCQLRLYSISGDLTWALDMGGQSWAADLSADGRYAVYATLAESSGEANHFALVDAAGGREVWRRQVEDLPASGQAVLSDPKCREIVFNHAGDLIALGTDAGDLYFLDRDTGQVRAHAFLYGMVRRILFAPDDSVAFVSSGDGYLYAVRPGDGGILWRSFVEAWAYTRGLDLSPDGQYLAVAAKTGFGVLVRTSDGSRVFSRFTGNFNTYVARFSPQGEGVFFGSKVHGVFLDLSGRPLWYTRKAHAAAFSPDGRYLVCGPDEESGLRVLHAASGTPVPEAMTAPYQAVGLTMCELTPDGSRLVTADEEGNLRIYQVE